MKKEGEGLIKYNVEFEEKELSSEISVKEINSLREELHMMELIGVDEDNVGFGDLSTRYRGGFIITGHDTGAHPKLNTHHYSYVTDFSIEKNLVKCTGEVMASSKSLSHGAIYGFDKKIMWVAHIHSDKLWNKHKHVLPTTDPEHLYGTIELVDNMIRLYKENELGGKVIVIGGHEDGIIAFGETSAEISSILLSL